MNTTIAGETISTDIVSQIFPASFWSASGVEICANISGSSDIYNPIKIEDGDLVDMYVLIRGQLGYLFDSYDINVGQRFPHVVAGDIFSADVVPDFIYRDKMSTNVFKIETGDGLDLPLTIGKYEVNFTGLLYTVSPGGSSIILHTDVMSKDYRELEVSVRNCKNAGTANMQLTLKCADLNNGGLDTIYSIPIKLTSNGFALDFSRKTDPSPPCIAAYAKSVMGILEEIANVMKEYKDSPMHVSAMM